MATSGYVNTNAYNGLYLQLVLSVSEQSIKNNQTTLDWTLKGAGSITASGTNWYTLSNTTVVINGETVYSKQENAYLKLYSGTVVASGSIVIDHESDGTKEISVSVKGGIYTWDVNCTGSGTMILDQIPRGLVHIDNGSSYKQYRAYIDDGTQWKPYMAHKDTGSDWVI